MDLSIASERLPPRRFLNLAAAPYRLVVPVTDKSTSYELVGRQPRTVNGCRGSCVRLMAAVAAAGQVLQGTCGWSDSGAPWSRPVGGSSAENKLRVFSGPGLGLFGCVEVDTSTYQIPSRHHVQKWVGATPQGFQFCFKAFGWLCSRGGQLAVLPASVRQLLPPTDEAHQRFTDLELLPPAATAEIWRLFHESIRPAQEAGKLGPVLFQFHLNFGPSADRRRYVEWCRSKLDPSIQMVVEFRSRQWVSEENGQLQATVEWLRTIGVALCASDDLEHEMRQGDRAQRGLQPGEIPRRLPIVARAPIPAFAFARVHRRRGNQRRLSAEEMAEWSLILRRWRDGGAGTGTGGGDPEGDDSEGDPALTGPIYFMWGTDHREQSTQNARALAAALGPQAFDWRAHVNSQAGVGSGKAGNAVAHSQLCTSQNSL